MKIDRNDALYSYVTSHTSYSWKGVPHQQRTKHLAAAARPLWLRLYGETPEQTLAGPDRGMLPQLDKMLAQMIITYEKGA